MSSLTRKIVRAARRAAVRAKTGKSIGAHRRIVGKGYAKLLSPAEVRRRMKRESKAPEAAN